MRQISARLWALAVLSGVLQVLPFPIAGPVPLWRTAFCWFAITPLLFAMTRGEKGRIALNPRHTALLGYVSGFVWYLGSCYWIYQTMAIYGGLGSLVAATILLLFCLYLGLYHALFGWLVGVLRHRFGAQVALLLSPFVWVAVELARARITGFPWDLLGTAQVDNPLLTRLGPITGVYGMSFVIAFVNALWLVRIYLKERRLTRPLLTAAGVLITVLYVLGLGRLRTLQKQTATATATLVQENLEVGEAAKGPEPTERELLESFTYLSRHPGDRVYLGMPELSGTRLVTFASKGETQKSDLIIWPESPAPFQEDELSFHETMSTLAAQSKTPMIVGNVAIKRSNESGRGFTLYNSASFVDSRGNFVGRYDKIHLVPFGEYVPFRGILFFADSLLHEVGTFSSGDQRSLFVTNGHRYGTFICYESIFGDEVRQFVRDGADVLINISNDGWYGDTSAPWQHLNMARMRAIENHRWVLRATNTGVTAAIDPYGRVVEAAPRHVRTSIRVGFGYEEDMTFYTRYGDLFAYSCAAITIATILESLRRRFTVN